MDENRKPRPLYEPAPATKAEAFAQWHRKMSQAKQMPALLEQLVGLDTWEVTHVGLSSVRLAVWFDEKAKGKHSDCFQAFQTQVGCELSMQPDEVGGEVDLDVWTVGLPTALAEQRDAEGRLLDTASDAEAWSQIRDTERDVWRLGSTVDTGFIGDVPMMMARLTARVRNLLAGYKRHRAMVARQDARCIELIEEAKRQMASMDLYEPTVYPIDMVGIGTYLNVTVITDGFAPYRFPEPHPVYTKDDVAKFVKTHRAAVDRCRHLEKVLQLLDAEPELPPPTEVGAAHLHWSLPEGARLDLTISMIVSPYKTFDGATYPNGSVFRFVATRPDSTPWRDTATSKWMTVASVSVDAGANDLAQAIARARGAYVMYRVSADRVTKAKADNPVLALQIDIDHDILSRMQETAELEMSNEAKTTPLIVNMNDLRGKGPRLKEKSQNFFTRYGSTAASIAESTGVEERRETLRGRLKSPEGYAKVGAVLQEELRKLLDRATTGCEVEETVCGICEANAAGHDHDHSSRETKWQETWHKEHPETKKWAETQRGVVSTPAGEVDHKRVMLDGLTKEQLASAKAPANDVAAERQRISDKYEPITPIADFFKAFKP